VSFENDVREVDGAAAALAGELTDLQGLAREIARSAKRLIGRIPAQRKDAAAHLESVGDFVLDAFGFNQWLNDQVAALRKDVDGVRADYSRFQRGLSSPAMQVQ